MLPGSALASFHLLAVAKHLVATNKSKLCKLISQNRNIVLDVIVTVDNFSTQLDDVSTVTLFSLARHNGGVQYKL